LDYKSFSYIKDWRIKVIEPFLATNALRMKVIEDDFFAINWNGDSDPIFEILKSIASRRRTHP
jgi:hypothetical protein